MSTAKHFGMRLAPHERRQIERLAEAQGTNMKEAILEAVRLQLDGLAASEMENGFLARAGHLRGVTTGPRDLSTNPDYRADFGQPEDR